jgi:hypothetical protein
VNSISKISEQTKPDKILQIFLISTVASDRCGWGVGNVPAVSTAFVQARQTVETVGSGFDVAAPG